ncbi:MAG: type II toxin-antitoxin system HicA family toxin [Pseudomonadota bacterium]
MNGYEKQVKEVLRKYGWYLLESGKGSHEIWTNGKKKVTVNCHCYSRHTANGIMKTAGINHKF